MPKGKIVTLSKQELEDAHRAVIELPEPVKTTFSVAEAIELMKDSIKAKLDSVPFLGNHP